MSENLPALTGKELIKLLQKDGWKECGKRTHGIAMRKKFADRTRITIIPTKGGSLPSGTLGAILSPKQTNIGRDGLLALINKQ